MALKFLRSKLYPLLRQQRVGFLPSSAGVSAGAPILSITTPVEEETIPCYDAKSFYPVHPGLFLNDRYEILIKLGWGRYSTVWLAKDLKRYVWFAPDWMFLLRWLYSWKWQKERYVTIKVNTTEVDSGKTGHELAVAQKLKTNPAHAGYPFIRSLLDNFELHKPDGGSHLCLVYEPMRETLSTYQSRWQTGSLPVKGVKVYLKILLLG